MSAVAVDRYGHRWTRSDLSSDGWNVLVSLTEDGRSIRRFRVEPVENSDPTDQSGIPPAVVKATGLKVRNILKTLASPLPDSLAADVERLKGQMTSAGRRPVRSDSLAAREWHETVLGLAEVAAANNTSPGVLVSSVFGVSIAAGHRWVYEARNYRAQAAGFEFTAPGLFDDE